MISMENKKFAPVYIHDLEWIGKRVREKNVKVCDVIHEMRCNMMIDESFLDYYRKRLEKAKENRKFAPTKEAEAFQCGCINELKDFIEHIENMMKYQK